MKSDLMTNYCRLAAIKAIKFRLSARRKAQNMSDVCNRYMYKAPMPAISRHYMLKY